MVTHLAYEDLRHQPGRAALSAISSAALVACFLLLLALSSALRELTSGEANSRNLVVISAQVVDPAQSGLKEAVVAALPGLAPGQVERVSPVLFRFMRIDDQVVQLRAAPEGDWTQVHGLALVDGRWPASEGEVALGEGTTQATGWALGATLHIYGSDFRVAGVVRAPGTKVLSVWMPLAEGLRLFGIARGYQMAVVQITPGADLETARARIERGLEGLGRYDVYLEDSLTGRYARALDDLSQLLGLVSGIALLALSLGTYHSTGLFLLERARQVGLLRALGFGPGAVTRLALLRAAALNGVAFLVGLAAGLAFLARFPDGGRIVLSGAVITLRVTPQAVGLGVGLTLAFTLLGAWGSARGMARRRVLDLLA